MKNYKVYLVKNKNNEIVYVGLTSCSLKRRFDGHCSRGKLNREEHKMELVQEYLTLEEAAILEKMLIKQYDLTHTGLNKSLGTSNGCSVIHTEETKDYLRSINKGKKVSPEHAAKNKVARLGRKNGEYWRQRMSEVKSKPVICIETGKIYSSIRKAAQDLNLAATKISLVCMGKRNHTGGYHFKYHEPIELNRNDSTDMSKKTQS